MLEEHLFIFFSGFINYKIIRAHVSGVIPSSFVKWSNILDKTDYQKLQSYKLPGRTGVQFNRHFEFI